MPQELLATLQYGLNEEMVVSPVDYFTRRSGMTLFSIHEAKNGQSR
ncbi:aerobic glycerol-3-phosphate dehydrogenase [Sporolactobacillus inulinus]|uniref:Aerobic glycerol-3-phosphate dehydrogenase n=1 Tax=Sporolactobacillus inulinus TaxID=2078 RepID=A0A4Y1ZE74_9BACL|nr:aerobic glycerol-3-phosphate dehydrogenase [Sporolactobacillus inulinus]